MPSGAYGYDVSGQQLNNTTPDRESLALIAGAVQGQPPAGGGTGGIPVVVTPPTVTPNFAAVPQSTSQVIPAGAKGWTAVCLTGTVTFGGVAALPAGWSDSDQNTLAAAITLTTASASTAYVRWNT
jgi:hypothetical protein